MFNSSKTPAIHSQTTNIVSHRFPLWIWIIIAVLATGLVILGLLFWRTEHKLSQTNHAGQPTATDSELIKQVGKLIVLPANETPTIATVSDLDKLKGQPFFEKAALGDRVLIYNQAKKAILYRPSTNQIIELAPLLDSAANTNTPAQ